MFEPVSVIITCFNLERYIGAAIESALAQHKAEGAEILVIDDCSTDGSAAIIQSYPGVRYIRTERNSGVLLATLAGMMVATGDLLFFLDGDDLWEADKLSACRDCFAADPAIALVTHDIIYIGSDDEMLAMTGRPGEEIGVLPAAARGEKVREGILDQGDYVWLGSAFSVRRSLMKFDNFADWVRALPDPANTYQDWPLAFWVAALPDVHMGYVPAKLLRYRLHQANHSGDARTADRAARNFGRAYQTTASLLGIAQMRALPGPTIEIARERAAFYDYQVDLYRGKRGSSLRKFVRSIGYLRARGLLAKELVRVSVISVFGAHAFVRMSSRRKVFRRLKVS